MKYKLEPIKEDKSDELISNLFYTSVLSAPSNLSKTRLEIHW